MLAALSFMALAVTTMVGVAGFLRASRVSAEYDINSPRLVYNSIAAIVVESFLFGLFLLAVSERLNYDFKFQSSHDPLTELYNRRAFDLAREPRNRKGIQSLFRFDRIETELQILDLTRFLDAKRFPLRLKTL